MSTAPQNWILPQRLALRHPLADISAGRRRQRAMPRAAQVSWRRTTRAGLLGEPRSPVRPPRAGMRLRACEPVVRVVGQELVGPVTAPLLLRGIDDTGDMP